MSCDLMNNSKTALLHVSPLRSLFHLILDIQIPHLHFGLLDGVCLIPSRTFTDVHRMYGQTLQLALCGGVCIHSDFTISILGVRAPCSQECHSQKL